MTAQNVKIKIISILLILNVNPVILAVKNVSMKQKMDVQIVNYQTPIYNMWIRLIYLELVLIAHQIVQLVVILVIMAVKHV